MSREISIKAAKKMRRIFLVIIALMAMTTASFATESDAGATITPKLAFTVDSNELLVFKQTEETNATFVKNHVPTIKRTYDARYYKPFINPYVPYSYMKMLSDLEKQYQWG